MSDLADSYTSFVVIKKDRKPKREPNKLVVINEEDLIRQVEIRPILYDKSLKGYRKSALRHQYWKEIAESVGSSVEECRKRWRSLRDAFSKHYKLMSRMEPVAYKRKKWIFYDQMSFIANFLDNSSLEIEETVLEDLQDNSHDEIMLHDATNEGEINVNEVTHNSFKTEPNMHAAIEEQQPNHHHHQHQNNSASIDIVDANQFITRIFPSPNNTTQYLTLEEQAQEHDNETDESNKKQQQSIKTNTLTPEEYGTLMNIDGDDKFLLSCSPILKRLSRKKNALARLKIQQILYNIEFSGEL